MPAWTSSQTPVAAPEDPFAKVIADAKLSREKLLAAFAGAGMAVADTEIATPVQLALAMPTADRFHRGDEQNAAEADPFSSLALSNASLGNLAYAEVDAGADHPLQLALASLSDDPFGMPDEFDSAAMPDSIDLPDAKPDAPRAKPAKADAEPAEAPSQARQAREERQAAGEARHAGARLCASGQARRRRFRQALQVAGGRRQGGGLRYFGSRGAYARRNQARSPLRHRQAWPTIRATCM